MDSQIIPIALLSNADLSKEVNRLSQEIHALNTFDTILIEKSKEFKAALTEYQMRLTRSKEELESILAS